MKNTMNTTFALNIGRQFGSGGREIGGKLAKRLNVAYYDKELIRLASKESGLDEKFFEDADEKTGFRLKDGLFGLGSSFLGGGYTDSYLCNETLFKIQSDVIREQAEKQSCIFVGRCADYILRDHPCTLTIFISADLKDRVERVVHNLTITEKKALELIEKTDKKRAAYYNYYSNKLWGVASSYDLCINSSKLGVDATVDFILQFWEAKKGG